MLDVKKPGKAVAPKFFTFPSSSVTVNLVQAQLHTMQLLEMNIMYVEGGTGCF
jgi:hypothetical protein